MVLSKRKIRREGAILPLLAVVLTAILVIVALTINSNWFMYSRINAQNTADISARSALIKVTSDSDFEGRVQRARDLSVRLYNLNLDRPGQDVSFDPSRVRFGNLVDPTQPEPVFNETTADSQRISAVRVDTPTAPQQRDVNVFLSNFVGGPDQVRITADATVSNRPVDVILCLDASRSMNRAPDKSFPPGGTTIHEPPLPESRWFELKETVRQFLASMRNVNPNARVGLVTFGGGKNSASTGVISDLDEDWARLEQGLTVVIANEIEDLVDTMESYATDFPALGLGTSIFDGIEFSRDAFETEVASSNHVILLSDGNQVAPGRSNPLIAARAAAAQDITIHTISFGGNISVLADIALETGGSNFTALTEEELDEAFRQLLGRFRVQLVD